MREPLKIPARRSLLGVVPSRHWCLPARRSLLALLALIVSVLAAGNAAAGMVGAATGLDPGGLAPIQAQTLTPAQGLSAQSRMQAAPRLMRGDYPSVGVSSRAIVWVLAQMHLFFGALVLAVPLFVLVIELVGVYTGDARYDDMAHEFMKISLTGFSLTAIFGGSLALALFLLYPDFMGYMMRVFGAQWLVYAALFFLESLFLYTYYLSLIHISEPTRLQV